MQFNMNSPQEYLEFLEEKYPLSEFLLSQKKTDIPGIYQNIHLEVRLDPALPFLFIINGTTGAGKDAITNYLIENRAVFKAITAVNRDRRLEEPEDNYIWMRKKSSDESDADYLHALIEEYNLIEFDLHHQNIYGLPKSSLTNAAQQGPVIVRNEPKGAKTLFQKLQGQFNIIILFVVPDSWQQIFERIHRKGEERDNVLTRLEDSLNMLLLSEETAHFYIHSTTNPKQYNQQIQYSGIEFTQKNTLALITKIQDLSGN